MSTYDTYVEVTRSLFPRGSIWFDSDEGDNTTKELCVRALAHDPARIADAIEAMVEGAMLDTLNADGATRWERLMGLDGTGLSLEERRAQIISKWRGYASPTIGNVRSVADAWSHLNPVVTEYEFPLFMMGVNAMGDPIRGDIWAVTLVVEYDGPSNPAFEAAVRPSVQTTTNILFLLR